ncbi:MAG: YeeE/YedE thiosulfate transporter family protein [Desulfovibrionales bacterium]
MGLRNKAWSPYAAGIVIGLLQIPALLIITSSLGASSSFVSVAAYFASLFDADISSIDYFSKHMTSLKYLWQGSMVVAIGVGAYISMRLSGAKRRSFSPAWTQTVGIKRLGSRMVMGFLGGFILLFGARWAGG